MDMPALTRVIEHLVDDLIARFTPKVNEV